MTRQQLAPKQLVSPPGWSDLIHVNIYKHMFLYVYIYIIFLYVEEERRSTDTHIPGRRRTRGSLEALSWWLSVLAQWTLFPAIQFFMKNSEKLKIMKNSERSEKKNKID